MTDHFLQFAGIELGVLASDVSAQEPAFLVNVGLPIPDGGALIKGGKEGEALFRQHFLAVFLVDKGSDALARLIRQLEPLVLKEIRDFISEGIVIVLHVPDPVGPHIGLAAVNLGFFGGQLLISIHLFPIGREGV